MAELMGRASGVCKGKGGSMHLSEPAVGLISTNAIVAGHIPMAGGAALSCAFRGTGQVVLCFFGDGASCEGEFFETLNMSMLWRVPLVFICENNGVAISVPTSKSQATPDIADRARGFGMPASIVDGNDVLAVREAVGSAVARARAGDGPAFVECKTVRWERHSAFSAGGADPVEQRRRWQRVDPIPRYRASLLAWGVADEAEIERVDSAAVRRRWPPSGPRPRRRRTRAPSRSGTTSTRPPAPELGDHESRLLPPGVGGEARGMGDGLAGARETPARSRALSACSGRSGRPDRGAGGAAGRRDGAGSGS